MAFADNELGKPLLTRCGKDWRLPRISLAIELCHDDNDEVIGFVVAWINVKDCDFL